MMGRYISTAPRVKKQQVFTVSGTFTPSPGLLAAGGVVEVRCVGGGGGGSTWNGSSLYLGGGGGSGENKTRIVKVNAPVTVLVGAGGAGRITNIVNNVQVIVSEATNGGITSFGGMVSANGGGGAGLVDGGSSQYFYVGGVAGGEGGFHGESSHASGGPGAPIGGNGGGPGGGTSLYALSDQDVMNGIPNSGGGGAGGNKFAAGNGGSGICIVTWEE